MPCVILPKGSHITLFSKNDSRSFILFVTGIETSVIGCSEKLRSRIGELDFIQQILLMLDEYDLDSKRYLPGANNRMCTV